MLSYSQSCKRISERLMGSMTGRKATESSRKLRQGKLLLSKTTFHISISLTSSVSQHIRKVSS